jgi:hypothetical protein
MPGDRSPFSRKPLTVTVAGVRAEIPYRPAAVWVEELGRLSVLAAVLAEDSAREALADALLAHPGASARLHEESLRILAEATGMKWWEAGRLMATSAGGEVLGRLVLAGVDPWNRSVGEWCAAVYALCVKGQDEKGRLRFEFSLSLPPPGYEDEWDDGQDPEVVAGQLAQMLGTW